MNWKGKTVAVWEEWTSGKYRAYKITFDGPWHLECDGNLIASWSDLQVIMREAELHQKRHS